MPGQPVGIVIDEDPTAGPDVATDGETLDWYVADKRLADEETGADWCAQRLREVSSLPTDSAVRQMIELAVDEVKETYGISDGEIKEEL
jgi:hypothetical protein